MMKDVTFKHGKTYVFKTLSGVIVRVYAKNMEYAIDTLRIFVTNPYKVEFIEVY